MAAENADTAPSWLPAKSWKHMLAGALGGITGALITCPLDVVKTRLQRDIYKGADRIQTLKTPNAVLTPWSLLRSAGRHFVETGSILVKIHATDGIRGLYTGLGPTLLAVIPARSVNFFVYGNGKQVLSQYLNDGVQNSWIHLIAAANAGVATGIVTNPIWVVRTRMQLEERKKGVSITAWKTVKTIGSEEGPRGFYRGLSASMLGVSESSLQWVLYEKFKAIQARRNISGQLIHDQSPLSTWLSTVLSSGSAKTIATVLTYPHEVVRTRLRQGTPTKYTGLLQSFKLILREEGARTFYNGLSAHLMRVIPNAIVTFTIFEAVMRNL